MLYMVVFLYLYVMFGRWLEGDALNLPFADNCFDAVTIGYGLRNVVDRLAAMKEIYRVLKLGSYFLRFFKYCLRCNLCKYIYLIS